MMLTACLGRPSEPTVVVATKYQEQKIPVQERPKKVLEPSLGALASILNPGAEIGGPSSWTGPCGPELVDLSLGALASILNPGAEIGGPSSWTRPRGPELVDPSLGALARILNPGAEIGSPSSWTRARGAVW